MKKVYHSNSNKVRTTSKSGAGTDSVYNPKWPHFEKMNFLKETLEMDPMVSFFDIQSNNFDDFFETRMSDSDIDEIVSTPKPQRALYQEKKSKSCPPPPKRKKNEESLSDTVLMETCRTLKKINDSSQNKENKVDDIDDGAAYGSLVRNKIRNLTPKKQLNFIREIQSSLNKYN